jgi:membrane-bound lytic murein transglycosylase B
MAAIIRLATIREKWVAMCATAVLVSVLLVPYTACASEPLFGKLQQRLIADGLDPDTVKTIYENSKIRPEYEVVAGNLVRSEATLDYEQFLSAYAVNKAERYLKRYHQPLEQAHHRFGVEPEVVVAVLMVETALGTYPGKYLSVNVLSTMAASAEPEVRAKILDSLTEEQLEMQSKTVISGRLAKRAARGFRELKALINYIQDNDLDPFTVYGSSEGAIGIPQFLPSNIQFYGRDGNDDGRIDLFNHHDAIASVAYFLRAHRWRRARSDKAKIKVLLYYNRSTYYAETVYTLAERLNGNKSL